MYTEGGDLFAEFLYVPSAEVTNWTLEIGGEKFTLADATVLGATSTTAVWSGSVPSAWTAGTSYSVKVTTSEPGAPTIVSATAEAGRTVKLDWSAPSSIGGSAITGYEYGHKKGGEARTWVAIDNSASLTSYTASGFDAETEYTFRLRASNSAGDGLWSNERSVRTGGLPTVTDIEISSSKRAAESRPFLPPYRANRSPTLVCFSRSA